MQTVTAVEWHRKGDYFSTVMPADILFECCLSQKCYIPHLSLVYYLTRMITFLKVMMIVTENVNLFKICFVMP